MPTSKCRLLANSSRTFVRQFSQTPARPVVCAYERRANKRRQFDSTQSAHAGRVIGTGHAACRILDHSSLRVTRQLEMLNIFLGYEQANRYALMDPQGNAAGFMVEEQTWAHMFGRQLYGTHRPFRILVLDLNGNVCLRIQRPFSLINSHVTVLDAAETGALVGESHQEWHMWRRRYNLFQSTSTKGEMDQFARIDAPFLSWDFPMVNEQGKVSGGVFRDFAGIGAELFTDYGLYAVCFDQLALAQRYNAASNTGLQAIAEHAMDLDKRAVALAAAVSIDFDYFSRHSRVGFGGMPWFFLPAATSNYAPPTENDEIDL
ncbi:hypothetical protein IWW50_000087 [Coemansia erecta]|nr:hypothetical protein GGF43_000370 [Coemansia sp. RSA 2618]KAJ2830730.1 hypothetical protein IWW50_000087 [Coemansia erecta]